MLHTFEVTVYNDRRGKNNKKTSKGKAYDQTLNSFLQSALLRSKLATLLLYME